MVSDAPASRVRRIRNELLELPALKTAIAIRYFQYARGKRTSRSSVAPEAGARPSRTNAIIAAAATPGMAAR